MVDSVENRREVKKTKDGKFEDEREVKKTKDGK